MSYIVRSQIRLLVKKLDMSMSREADPVISSALEDIIKRAAIRARGNGRKVIKARDV